MPSGDMGMKMKRAITLSAMMIGMLSATPAPAQTDDEIYARYSREYDRCLDSAAGYTGKFLKCNAEEWKNHDNRLNQIYKHS